MKTLAVLEIPQFYSLYGQVARISTPLVHDGDWNRDKVTQTTRYYCAVCGTYFKVEHRIRGNLTGYANEPFNDRFVTCPCCGHTSHSYSYLSETYWFPEFEGQTSQAPVSMRLRLDEIADGFVLKSYEKVVYIDADRHVWIRYQQEWFRFDVRHRKALFSVRQGSHREIRFQTEFGNPFDLTLYQMSMLRHLHKRNLSYSRLYDDYAFKEDKDTGDGVKGLLRALREGIRRKWKAIHGYDPGSLYVSTGTEYGTMLHPMMNLAFRMLYPDTANLPRVFRETDYSIKSYLQLRRLDAGNPYGDYEAARAAVNSLQGIIQQAGLPDKPFVRRILHSDFFAAGELRYAWALSGGSVDRMQNILKAIGWTMKDGTLMRDKHAPSHLLSDMLKRYCQYWSTDTVLRFFRNTPVEILRDTLSLFEQLPEKLRRQATGMRLKKVHDWAVMLHSEIRDKGFDLEVPEAVVRRLQMQVDSGLLRAFVPRHSSQLIEASNTLHNCVRTYDRRVLTKQCSIVLMTDDLGRLRACLEVKDNALVQAKLKFNAPVRDDAAINGAVLDWCRKAGLTIRTDDVRQMQYPAVLKKERRKAV